MKNMQIRPDDSVNQHFTVLARIKIAENGCCSDRDFLLTVNPIKPSAERPDGRNYSCQCSCGSWCTTGCRTAGEAINEYLAMCERAVPVL